MTTVVDSSRGGGQAFTVGPMLGNDVLPDRVVPDLDVLTDVLDQSEPEPESVDGGPNNLENAS